MAITTVDDIKTPEDVRTVLATSPDIDAKNVNIVEQPGRGSSPIQDVIIDYAQKVGERGLRRAKITMYTTDKKTYSWENGTVPSILKQILEPATPATPQRDFHFTMAQVVQWFSDTGKTLLDEDEVNISRDGKFDRVTARLIVTETTGEGKDAVTTEFVTPFEALVNKAPNGNAIVRQVK